MAVDIVRTSEDAVLGGRLVLRQPLKGHRVGHDAILLAAACSAHSGDHLVDLGAGVGAAGLAVARRVENVSVTLVEIEPALAELAGDNAAHNALAGRVRAICLDVGASATDFAAVGLRPQTFDHVLMNPPFNAAQNPSPDRGRRLAHEAVPDTLPLWLGTAARLLRSGGVVTLIWRADGLVDLFQGLAGNFGAIAVLPIHPKLGLPAIRVLIRGVRGGAAPLSLLPGIILADNAGKPTEAAEAVLRRGAALPLAEL
jgi:tRNA1(Val) A37 N6-methylase TrmN6